jgi:YfiH family protein
MIELLYPDWPAPANVRAVSTTRRGGVSAAPFDSLNLGLHTVDDTASVIRNRQRLLSALQLPRQPTWLKQVHGSGVIDAGALNGPAEADASYTHRSGPVCSVMVADCLPVLLCARDGSCVAAVHAGWRGLAAQVIAACVACLQCSADNLLVWLGPAIGPQAFEVGPEVRDVFLQLDQGNKECFVAGQGDRWLADIYALARRQLKTLGITAIYGGDRCTVSESEWFFSYRRDGSNSGRMASLIWLAADEHA